MRMPCRLWVKRVFEGALTRPKNAKYHKKRQVPQSEQMVMVKIIFGYLAA